LWRNRQTEAQLVLRPKPRNHRGDFEAEITKPKLPVLRPKQGNPPPPWFWGSTKKSTTGFEAKPGETVATGFEAKLEKIVEVGFEAKPLETVATGFDAKPLKTITIGFDAKPVKTIAASFEAKPPETVTTGFEAKPTKTITTGFDAKPAKTIQVVLRPNHSQTIDLGFEARPRNPCSSSSCARCRPSPIPCSRSPTPATVLVAARHAAPATCTPRDMQTRFSKRNKEKRKTKWNCPGF
jgi:hypothetical protein